MLDMSDHEGCLGLCRKSRRSRPIWVMASLDPWKKMTVERLTVQLLESGFARHASVFARFEDGMSWPSMHTPSAEYRSVIDS